MLVSSKAQQLLCARVCADVQVLKTHSTTIRVGYQPILHSQNSRCSVTIEQILNKVSARPSAAEGGDATPRDATRRDLQGDGETVDEDEFAACLQTGDTAEVMLRLNYGKRQFIKPGNHVLLCEGRTKVVGVVKSTYDD